MINLILNQLLKVSLFNLFLEIIIKSRGGVTKFKIRCPRYVYTTTIEDPVKAARIKAAIPGSIQKVELGGKKETKATGKKAPKN